jgi:hypothetical protein
MNMTEEDEKLMLETLGKAVSAKESGRHADAKAAALELLELLIKHGMMEST